MKIAISRSTLHKGSGQVVHIRELVSRLEKMGHRVTVFSRSVEEDPGFHTCRVEFFFDDVPFIRHGGFGLKGGLMVQNYDIIHSQYHPGIFMGNMGRFLRGKRHVFTFHGFTPSKVWKNPIQKVKMIDHRIGTFMGLHLGVDHVITVSRYLRDVLLNSYKFDPRKATVVYNGVDLERFNPDIDGDILRGELGLQDTPTILFLGRIAPYKGPQYLVMAAPMVLREIPDVRFIIAGSGRYDVPSLLQLTKKLGVEKEFIFTGYIPDEKIPWMYASSDIFCYPSLWEGFGLTLAEAQACGKPVVAFNSCAVPEVVKNNETGILVPTKDYKRIAEALIDLLSDKKRRTRMGVRGRKRVETMFSWENMTRRTVEVYERVLKE